MSGQQKVPLPQSMREMEREPQQSRIYLRQRCLWSQLLWNSSAGDQVTTKENVAYISGSYNIQGKSMLQSSEKKVPSNVAVPAPSFNNDAVGV